MAPQLAPPESLDLDAAPRPRSELAWVELDGEVVVYDEEAETLHTLNATATIVWRCLDGSVTLRELADELAEVFGVAPATVASDVLQMVHQLGRSGLLVGVAADPDEVAAHRLTVEEHRHDDC